MTTLTTKPRVIVFCERIDNESFCESIVRELGAYCEVLPCGPGWSAQSLEDVDPTGTSFYLELDAASGRFDRPPGLDRLKVPKFAWLIDTHKKPAFHAQVSSEMDLTFFAMKNWGHRLTGNTAWLPVHCDSEIFFPQERERDLDVVFCGSHLWRADPLLRIAKRHGLQVEVTTTSGAREKSQTAELYARSKLVFNRHVTNDLNFRVVEAAACGRVLLSDAQYNGQYELLEDERHCLYYKDERDLEAQILRVLQDPELRFRLEQAAGERAQLRHTTRARVAQLHGGIEAFLASRPADSRPTSAPAPVSVGRLPAPADSAPPRRWLVLPGPGRSTVSRLSYAELLAAELASDGAEVTVARRQRCQLALPAATSGGLRVVELRLGALPSPVGLSNVLLSEATSLQFALERLVEREGPFDAVLTEGAQGALIGKSLCERQRLPLYLALEHCQVALRENRLTREQLYLAELENWGTRAAYEVWAPTEEAASAIRNYYKTYRVRVCAPPVPDYSPPPAPERLLAALGLEGEPGVLVLTSPLSRAAARELLQSSAPPPPGGILIVDDGLWFAGEDRSLVRLSELAVAGPALAALLLTAQAVVATDPRDPRRREALALGVPVGLRAALPRAVGRDGFSQRAREVICAAS